MPGKHKDPTISFRPSYSDRIRIDEKIKVCGMGKKDFFVRSCLNDNICVVGSKNHILHLVDEVRILTDNIADLQRNILTSNICMEDAEDLMQEYTAFVSELLNMLKAASYLWVENKSAPSAGNTKDI